MCASKGRIMEGRIIGIRLNACSIILSTIILSSLSTSLQHATEYLSLKTGFWRSPVSYSVSRAIGENDYVYFNLVQQSGIFYTIN